MLARIRSDRAIGIIRTETTEQALATARAAIAGGFRMVEITYGVPRATEVIAELVRQNKSEIVLGAGTVLNAVQVAEAVQAGARFVVSPCVVAEMIDAARELEVVSIPGAFTPTEIYTAYSLGADMVKLFPAVRFGPEYLKAIRGPLPQIPIVPTAGVNTQNVREWFNAGASAVGAAGAVFDPTVIQSGDWEKVQEIARGFTHAVEAAG